MPLPALPPNYQQQAYEALERSLPGKWFIGLPAKTSPLYPLLWGLAGVFAQARVTSEAVLKNSIPSLSSGPWLSLHLLGIGLTRKPTETDASARERYTWEFKPTRNTRAGELAALQRFTGLQPPTLRLEGDRSRSKYGQFRVVVEDVTCLLYTSPSPRD